MVVSSQAGLPRVPGAVHCTLAPKPPSDAPDSPHLVEARHVTTSGSALPGAGKTDGTITWASHWHSLAHDPVDHFLVRLQPSPPGALLDSPALTLFLMLGKKHRVLLVELRDR